MTYSRPTLQEEEFLPTGFTEVRKDFLFLFSLSLLWHGLLQLVWGTDRWWEAEDCVFLGASGVEQQWRMGWGATPTQWPTPLCEEENHQNRNGTEVFWGRGRCLSLQWKMPVPLLKLEACRSLYYCNKILL